MGKEIIHAGDQNGKCLNCHWFSPAITIEFESKYEYGGKCNYERKEEVDVNFNNYCPEFTIRKDGRTHGLLIELQQFVSNLKNNYRNLDMVDINKMEFAEETIKQLSQ